jgi:Flp pilus assembly protein TadB
VAQSNPAHAGIPPHVWQSANPGAQRQNGGFVIDNNVLFGAGPETLWVKSYREWGVESTQPDTAGVKAYPSIRESFPGEPAYSSFRLLRSGFTETMPAVPNLDAEAAYEVWLDSHTVEVMMWVDNHHRVPAGKELSKKAYIYSQTFDVWQDGADKYSFVLARGSKSTTPVHLLSALRWLVKYHYLNTSDTLTEVDFGWEIVSTGGVKADFGVTGYAVTTQQKLPPPKAQPTVSATTGLPLSLVIGLAAVFAALFLAALLMVGRVARVGEDRALLGMFEKYGPRKQQVAVKNDDENQRAVATAAVGAVTRVMSSGTQDRLSKRLDLAGVKRKPAEWATLGVCLAVGIAATLSIVTNYVFIGVLGGAVIGWLTMRLALSVRILRRRAAFSDQLPDLLQLIASTLQAGFSLPQALDAVVREENQPAAGEFSRALAEARIGADLDTALEAIANRMDSDDLRWTVMAIRIQQGVGGNLAEVLLTIAETIRERAYLRRQVRALSAEGRLSAYILVALPLVVATWLFVSSATYMRPLYTTVMGEFMLVLAVILLLVGTFWMRRVIKVEI